MVYGAALGATAADNDDDEGSGGFGLRVVKLGQRVNTNCFDLCPC